MVWANGRVELCHLQEHARASIMCPFLLLQNIQKSWIDVAFYTGIPGVFPDVSLTAERIVVKVFTSLAKSNSVLALRLMNSEDCTTMPQIVIRARMGL